VIDNLLTALPFHFSSFNIWYCYFLALSLDDQTLLPPSTMTPLIPASSSIEDPTKPSSYLIFVSKFDNALYSLFEKTLFPDSSVPFLGLRKELKRLRTHWS
jgi:hypothetical protein